MLICSKVLGWPFTPVGCTLLRSASIRLEPRPFQLKISGAHALFAAKRIMNEFFNTDACASEVCPDGWISVIEKNRCVIPDHNYIIY